MRIIYMLIALALLWISVPCFAQLPQVYLNTKQSQTLGALSKTAPLFVVIDNEKRADDAALIAAVKSYWKIGSVKYMSTLEFLVKYKEQSFDPGNLYLYNNTSMDLNNLGGKKVRISSGNVEDIPSIYNGFYLTNSPYKLINSPSNKTAPPYLYFSADALTDSKQEPIKGFYDLMVKNFNHDVLYCQDETNFLKSSKKLKRKNGVQVFTKDSITNKTILLVKEQTNIQDKKTNDAGEKKSQVATKKSENKHVTEKYEAKNTMVVFPEDIQYAVKKSDKNILLYNGAALYSPVDGSVYATARGKSSGMAGFLRYVSLVITVGTIVFFVIYINR